MYRYDAPKPCALEDSDTTSTSGAASDEEHLNDTGTDDEHSTDAGSAALAMSRVSPSWCNKLNFEGENFTMHASLLPERYHLAASELMSACTFVNHGLLSSFFAFFVFMLSVQPPLLFNDLAVDGTSQCQQQLQLSLRHAPALHLEIVQEGLARGVLPIMDANLRTRCKDALAIYATLYNDRAVHGQSFLHLEGGRRKGQYSLIELLGDVLIL